MPDGDKLGRAFTVGLVVVLAAVAVWACPRQVQAGDAGEFATIMLRGGVPHPSGYPFMRLLGLLARALWAMGVPPALAAALPCAAASVAGFALFHRVALRAATPAGAPPGLGSALVATFAVALVALGTPVVLHTNDSEVWGPLVFFAGLVVHTAVVRRASPLWLGAVFGLAVSHHLSAALLLPLVVAAALPWPARPRAVLRAGGLGVGGGLLALVPAYLSLMLGDGAWRWGETHSLAGLWHHVTRADYGVFSLSLHAERPDALDLLARVAGSLGGNLSAGLVPIAAIGGALAVLVVVVAVARPGGGLDLRARIGLGGAVVLAGALFPLLHNIDPTSPFGAWILERFDILPLALLTPLIAAALHRLPTLAADKRTVGVGLTACGALLLVRQSVVTAWHGVPSDNPHVQRYAEAALLSPANARAVIVGTDDHRIFPILYAQSVLGLGEHVLYIDASLLMHPWYRAWLRTREPSLPDINKPVRLLTALAADPSWNDAGLYLSNDFSRHSAALPRAPQGVLWRVLIRPGQPPPTVDNVVEAHRAALSRIGAPSLAPAYAAHPFASDLGAAFPARTNELAAALRAQGREADAEALMRDAVAGTATAPAEPGIAPDPG